MILSPKSRNIGEGNPRSHFTVKQIKKLRRAAVRDSTGGASKIGRLPYGWLSEKAREYKTSPGVVSDIVRGKTWQSVKGFKYVSIG